MLDQFVRLKSLSGIGDGRLEGCQNRILPVLCSEPGGLGIEIVPFRNARRSTRRREVVRNRGLVISGHLMQMGSNGIEPIVAGKAFIGVQGR